jgi:hypothetical protein
VFHRFAAFVLACLPLMAVAQVYQYRDAQGRMVYSDTPPPGVNATRKAVNAAPPAGDTSKTLQDKVQDFQKRRDEATDREAKAAKDKAEKDKAAENCSRARNKLAALQSGQRIVRYNAQGEREFLDDAGREAESAQAQQSVTEWCK